MVSTTTDRTQKKHYSHVDSIVLLSNLIEKTIDIRSDSGWAHLMNDDEEEFQRDYNRLIELQKEMFEVEWAAVSYPSHHS